MDRADLPRSTFHRSELPIRDWTSGEIDPAVILVRLLRANAQLITDLNERFAEAGLPQFDVARLLWLWSEHNVPSAITKVAHGLGLSRSAASRLVERAEKRGLVERSRDVADGRETSVRVTTLGRATIHRFDAALRVASSDFRFDREVAEWLGRPAPPVSARQPRGGRRRRPEVP